MPWINSFKNYSAKRTFSKIGQLEKLALHFSELAYIRDEGEISKSTL